MSKKFQILALDGGGFKGIFSAALLAHFEEDFKVNIADHFDLITGTSTGGIIALALSIGIKPKDIVKFYVEEGPLIFPSGCFLSLKQYFKAKYSSGNLEKALKKYFGEKKLSDCRVKVIIPTFNLGENHVYIFKTPHHSRLTRDFKVPLWKVAMATTAAPTFFPSFTGVDRIRLIDGGIWANNPTLVGITEAKSVLNIPLNQTRVLNIGTTDEVMDRSKKLDFGGIWQWKKDVVDIIMSGQSISVFTTASHLIGSENVRRISPIVPDGLFKLDKLSVDDLMSKAAHFSREYSPILKREFLDHYTDTFKPLLS